MSETARRTSDVANESSCSDTATLSQFIEEMTPVQPSGNCGESVLTEVNPDIWSQNHLKLSHTVLFVLYFDVIYIQDNWPGTNMVSLFLVSFIFPQLSVLWSQYLTSRGINRYDLNSENSIEKNKYGRKMRAVGS